MASWYTSRHRNDGDSDLENRDPPNERRATQTYTELPGSATLSPTHAPIPHLAKLLSFQQGLGQIAPETETSPGQSRETHAQAVPSSPWQAELPFVSDLHRSWKEHREFPGILHPPSANANILHNQAHLAKREISARVTLSPQLQAARSMLLPRLAPALFPLGT